MEYFFIPSAWQMLTFKKASLCNFKCSPYPLTYSEVILLNLLIVLLLWFCVSCQRSFSAECILHIYKCSIRPCTEYWCHAAILYLKIFDKIKRLTYNLIDTDLASQLKSHFHHHNVLWFCLQQIFPCIIFKLSSLISPLQ